MGPKSRTETAFCNKFSLKHFPWEVFLDMFPNNQRTLWSTNEQMNRSISKIWCQQYLEAPAGQIMCPVYISQREKNVLQT